MKKQIDFNHESKTLNEALNVKDLGSKVSDVVTEFFTNDELRRQSHVAELLHNSMDYEHILALATMEVMEVIEGLSNSGKLKSVQGLLDELIRELKDDKA
jgi:hypothetical protein